MSSNQKYQQQQQQQQPVCIEVSSSKLQHSSKKRFNWKKATVVTIFSILLVSLLGFFFHQKTPCTGKGCPVTNSYYSMMGIRRSRTFNFYEQDKIDTSLPEYTFFSPCNGKITSIGAVGQKVEKGDVVFKLEAMKMTFSVTAKAAGTIKTIYKSADSMVSGNEKIVTLQN